MVKTALLLIFCLITVPTIAAEKYLVFAAASMKDAIEEIAKAYRADTGNNLVLSFAGTARLARQIDRGAPADVFISADEAWMNWLVERKLIAPGDKAIIAGNRLVIAVRREIENWADPLAMLSSGLAAMADPDAIPAGRYAKQALTSLKLWEKISKTIIRTDNVRLALALVTRGEVEAAIVYGSDVAAEPDLRNALIFNPETHQKIRYPAAILKSAKAGAKDVLKYLVSAKARRVFEERGFQPVAP